MKRFLLSLLAACACLLSATVAGAAQVTSEEVALAVMDHVQSHLDMMGEGLQAVQVFSVRDMPLPDGPRQWRVEWPEEDAVPGRINVPLTILVNGKAEVSMRVPVLVERRVRVPVLKRAVERGEQIVPSDLEWLQVSLMRGDEGMIERVDELVGLSASRRIQPGIPIKATWLEQPVAVKRGERVQATLIKNGIHIELEGKALSKGRIGDMIPVQNLDSLRPFLALVVSPGRVQVQ